MYVLVVDDSRTSRSFFSKAVSHAIDLPVLAVESAEEALDLLHAGTEIATIILDYHLPGMTGLDMLIRVKETPAWQDIPVLVTTGSEYDESLITECIRLGAADFMEKKYRPAIFTARIRHCINSYITCKQSSELKKKLVDAVSMQKTLLSNTLPARISEDLMTTGKFRPLHCRDAAVFFVDVCDFTRFTKSNSSIKLVSNLNRLVGRLERISDEYGLEKIKTIGDAYMAVGGVLEESYSLDRVVEAGFQAIRETQSLEIGWEVKVGIATGPLIAGIIGHKRIQFDVWGNTVNLASRMCDVGGAGVVAIPLEQLQTIPVPPEISQIVERDVKGLGPIKIALLKLPQ